MLERFEGNPILKPNPSSNWESKAVFNCAAIKVGGEVYLLYRAIGEYEQYISRFGLACSRDGINFERMEGPVFEPSEEYEVGGCEDPRVVELDGALYVTYVAHSGSALNGGGAKGALLRWGLPKKFERVGVITPAEVVDRDIVLFSERVGGKYLMLHRPHNWVGATYGTSKPGIWMAHSDDLRRWYNHKLIMKPERSWESRKIGAGPPPIKTEEGWLLLYHGVEGRRGETIYRAGAALLDLHNPSRVIARSREPILEPTEDYERYGDVPNVVFPEGAVVLEGKLYLYYGGGDKVCCLAMVKLRELIDWLLRNEKGGGG